MHFVPFPRPAHCRHVALAMLLLGAIAAPTTGCAQNGAPPPATALPPPGYAALADLIVDSPVVADLTIRSATRIKGAEAASVPVGLARFYVEADVNALIRGPGAMPPQLGYLVDVATDSRGRIATLKRERVLIFARPVSGRIGQVQLVAPSAQQSWSPAADALTRRIVAELVASDAPPIITGIGNAFHVPGSLPGESETQIFLTTADDRPVSLTILRRPGEQPRWAVALSEIVDDAAAPPARDTLLWYRLACSLPLTLPPGSVASMAPADAAVAREDYRFVLRQIGTCGRAPTLAG